MELSIITFFLGVIITFLISRHYYQKGNEDQKKLFDSLSSEVKSIIGESHSKNLSVVELNKILEDKIFDKDSNKLLRYKACPKCGSSNIHYYKDYYITEDEDGPSGLPIKAVRCEDCNWSTTEYNEQERIINS